MIFPSSFRELVLTVVGGALAFLAFWALLVVWLCVPEDWLV